MIFATFPTSLFRVFPTSVGLGDELDWKSVHSIQEYPIQSAFCIPAPGTKVERGMYIRHNVSALEVSYFKNIHCTVLFGVEWIWQIVPRCMDSVRIVFE